MKLNKKIIISIVVFLLCISFIFIWIISQQESDKKKIKDIEKKAAAIENIQVNSAEIIYCDDNILIFKDYYGLFVYSWSDNQLINSLDMKYIDCDKNQGDNVCQFDTYNLGQIIKLFNQSETYYFDWKSNKLSASYNESEANKDNESNIHSFLNEKTKMSAYSFNYVENNGEIIYLTCSSGEAANVMLVAEKNGEIVKTENIFN